MGELIGIEGRAGDGPVEANGVRYAEESCDTLASRCERQEFELGMLVREAKRALTEGSEVIHGDAIHRTLKAIDALEAYAISGDTVAHMQQELVLRATKERRQRSIDVTVLDNKVKTLEHTLQMNARRNRDEREENALERSRLNGLREEADAIRLEGIHLKESFEELCTKVKNAQEDAKLYKEQVESMKDQSVWIMREREKLGKVHEEDQRTIQEQAKLISELEDIKCQYITLGESKRAADLARDKGVIELRAAESKAKSADARRAEVQEQLEGELDRFKNELGRAKKLAGESALEASKFEAALEDAKREISALNAEVKNLIQENGCLEERVLRNEQSLAKARGSLSTASKDLALAQSTIAGQEKAIHAHKDQIMELEGMCNRQQEHNQHLQHSLQDIRQDRNDLECALQKSQDKLHSTLDELQNTHVALMDIRVEYDHVVALKADLQAAYDTKVEILDAETLCRTELENKLQASKSELATTANALSTCSDRVQILENKLKRAVEVRALCEKDRLAAEIEARKAIEAFSIEKQHSAEAMHLAAKAKGLSDSAAERLGLANKVGRSFKIEAERLKEAQVHALAILKPLSSALSRDRDCLLQYIDFALDLQRNLWAELPLELRSQSPWRHGLEEIEKNMYRCSTICAESTTSSDLDAVICSLTESQVTSAKFWQELGRKDQSQLTSPASSSEDSALFSMPQETESKGKGFTRSPFSAKIVQNTTERVRQLVESAMETADEEGELVVPSGSYEKAKEESIVPAVSNEIMRAAQELLNAQTKAFNEYQSVREERVLELERTVHTLQGSERVREAVLVQMRAEMKVAAERKTSLAAEDSSRVAQAESKWLRAEADLRSEISSRRWRERYVSDLMRSFRACQDEIKRLQRKPCSSSYSQTSRAEIEARNGGQNHSKEYFNAQQKSGRDTRARAQQPPCTTSESAWGEISMVVDLRKVTPLLTVEQTAAVCTSLIDGKIRYDSGVPLSAPTFASEVRHSAEATHKAVTHNGDSTLLPSPRMLSLIEYTQMHFLHKYGTMPQAEAKLQCFLTSLLLHYGLIHVSGLKRASKDAIDVVEHFVRTACLVARDDASSQPGPHKTQWSRLKLNLEHPFATATGHDRIMASQLRTPKSEAEAYAYKRKVKSWSTDIRLVRRLISNASLGLNSRRHHHTDSESHGENHHLLPALYRARPRRIPDPAYDVAAALATPQANRAASELVDSLEGTHVRETMYKDPVAFARMVLQGDGSGDVGLGLQVTEELLPQLHLMLADCCEILHFRQHFGSNLLRGSRMQHPVCSNGKSKRKHPVDLYVKFGDRIEAHALYLPFSGLAKPMVVLSSAAIDFLRPSELEALMAGSLAKLLLYPEACTLAFLVGTEAPGQICGRVRLMANMGIPCRDREPLMRLSESFGREAEAVADRGGLLATQDHSDVIGLLMRQAAGTQILSHDLSVEKFLAGIFDGVHCSCDPLARRVLGILAYAKSSAYIELMHGQNSGIRCLDNPREASFPSKGRRPSARGPTKGGPDLPALVAA